MAAESGKELAMFSVLPEGGSTQLLQVHLRFAEFFHFRGRVIYSNHTQAKLSQIQEGWQWISKALTERPLLQWVNLTNQLQIVGLTHSQHSGPILILDLNAYREGLYVSHPHLLATRLPLGGQRKAQQLADLVFVGFNNSGLLEQSVVLQAQGGSVVMEKYLGVDEEFCIYDHRCVMAVSETMQVELITKEGEAKIGKFKGPGWLFFETGQRKQEGGVRTKFAVLLVLAVCYICLLLLQ